MASVEIIEEISKFYDIKQKVDKYGFTCYYITHCNIDILIGTKYPGGSHITYSNFNADTKTLREYIDKNILLIDKINEIFEFTICDNWCDIILIGNAKIYCQFRRGVYIEHLSSSKIYDNVCDVIEYLKEYCSECIKQGDIKIALKD